MQTGDNQTLKKRRKKGEEQMSKDKMNSPRKSDGGRRTKVHSIFLR